tara:strand:- start:498 stop:1352 length:855 start_codon:yes stop_codon:yes gene_type:complete
MFEVFYKKYSDYIIESSNDLLIYLIPGQELYSNYEIFQYIGIKRAEAFNVFNSKSPETDIEERDKFFTHMIIWDKRTKELSGGQRFLFSKKGCLKNKKYSYIEEYHPNSYDKLKKESFCEIGRTFVMPRFHNRKMLMELIRGFIRIPEANNINIGIGLISFDHRNLKRKCVNKFLNILNNSKKRSLNLPIGKYLLEDQTISRNNSIKLFFDSENLKFIEKELQGIDENFQMPTVLKPYLRCCDLSYESYSIAKNYNQIMQLLFSGRSEDISEKQRSLLKKYNSF